MQPVADHRQTRATRLTSLLDELDETLRAGDTTELAPSATGFTVLDETLNGGLRAGELLLLGGPPGVGKTIAALQMARHAAQAGRTALFICYEHEESTLAARLLALEVGETGDESNAGRRVSALMLAGAQAGRSLADAVGEDPGLAAALDRVKSYAHNLVLVRASGAHTGLSQLDDLLADHTQAGSVPVVFIDYLQKVPIAPEPDTEAEKITRSVEGLKDLALSHRAPVVVVSAVDAAGLAASRLRLRHLRGSSAIAFEADVVVMLNDKMRAVSKVHLAYDEVGAKRFREWVVFSIEKNRGGPTLIDLEFRKDFIHFRFDPDGAIVSEKLVDERMDEAAF